MTTTRIVVAGALLAMAGTVQAQSPGADRVVKVLPTIYVPPGCDGVKPGHFKVSSGTTYLKTGIETSIPENRQRAVENGVRVTTEAIQQNGQDKSAGAWYTLGRLYLQQGDVAGADSAFARAEQLAPGCKEDIAKLRQMAWVPLVNAGIEFTKAQNNDSAKVYFGQANTIFRGKPQGLSAMGVMYSNAGQTDSAVYYLREAAKSAEAANLPEERNQATFNAAIMLSRGGKQQEAAAELEKYLQWVPNDIEAKRALASAYRASGQPEKAQALDQQIIAAGGNAGAPGAAAGVASSDVFNIGVTAFNEKRYDAAAKAFEQVTEREPWNRDAWYNLANTYYALKDAAGLTRASRRLTEIEPMSEDAYKLLGQGLRDSKKQDEQLKVVEKILALPVNVQVTNLTRSPTGATVTGTATGRAATNAAGTKLKPVPVTLVFELLDQQGNVIATQETAVPALNPEQTHEFKVEAQGSGISAWRYKRK